MHYEQQTGGNHAKNKTITILFKHDKNNGKYRDSEVLQKNEGIKILTIYSNLFIWQQVEDVLKEVPLSFVDFINDF